MTGVRVANDDGTEIVRARDISVASLDYDGNVNVRLPGADGAVMTVVAHRAHREERRPDDFHRQRERWADEREAGLDELARKLHAPAVSREERSLQAIGRARVMLSEGGKRLDRSQAALERAAALVGREQAEVDRRSAEGARGLHRQVVDPSEQLERAREPRGRIAASAAALARTGEEVARIHDELAARRPGGAGEYRRIAGEARKAASQARDIERKFSN